MIASAGLSPNLAGMMGNMDPEKLKEIQAAYEQAMKDPETAKKVNAQMAQMQGMMNNPMVAKQMAAMNNMIANPDMQRRIAGLKDDPDFQEFFQDVQKNGPSAMMKYSNDAAFLKKLNDKLGGEEAIRAAGGTSPWTCSAARPRLRRPRRHLEVETLHDAARYGDTEAGRTSSPSGRMWMRATRRSARRCTTPSRLGRATPARRSSTCSWARTAT